MKLGAHVSVAGGLHNAVNCAAGLGRAGTILACYFIKYKNFSAKEAIEKIRKERPGSIQSDVQELAISYYEKYVRN